MAGYGNRNAPNISPESLEPQHSETRFGRDDSHAYSGGHETYGSGTTGGAGFGNKSSSHDPNSHDNSDIRFDSYKDTAPYSGRREHGSGTVGGAGYGNKTGSFSESHDSSMGKVMEKLGKVVHNEGLVEKGRKKRVEKGFGQDDDEVTEKM